jgi:hypothetical protein
MAAIPKLIPLAHTSGDPVAVDRSPLWIGSGSSCTLRIYLPGVADRAASIMEREDGVYLSPFPGAKAPQLDGQAVTGATRLRDGQTIEFAPAARYEFATGAPRPKPVIVEEPQPQYGEAPRKKRRRRWRSRSGPGGFPILPAIVIALILAVVAVGGYFIYQTYFSGPPIEEGPPPLTQFEGQLYDSLMVASTASIERGSTLLGLGLREPALREFARALTNFEASPLRDNGWVRPRIDALAQTIAAIYAGSKLAIPDGLRRARSSLTDLSRSLGARLSVDEFRNSVASTRTAYTARFHTDFRITGTDHPEHLSLYGPGGAVDIGVHELSRDEVAFLVAAFHSAGIRVKDFSQDDILRAEIAAAIGAGKLDQAGTALHIHIDRFADHSDRWTTR